MGVPDHDGKPTVQVHEKYGIWKLVKKFPIMVKYINADDSIFGPKFDYLKVKTLRKVNK